MSKKLRNSGDSKVEIHNVKSLRAKLQSLQKEIGLSENEITIILFTSLNHDYLTNMLVQAGEFMLWFNINFVGESREEIDFKQNKQEIWEATVTLAECVLKCAMKLGPLERKEITTQKWWNRERFSIFGNHLAKILNSDAAMKKELRSLFKSQNDKLSYFDLFQFIEKRLKIKLRDWQEDALETRLDRLGLAFIEFNEFNEFCMGYGIDFGVPLLENDLEELLDIKLNVSYNDYKLTPADFFMGCQTMLKSEKATLTKCVQIWDKLNKKGEKKFKDTEFGPVNAKDIIGASECMYDQGKIPQKGYPEPMNCEWVWAEELCDPGEIPQFVDDGAASNDCVQGNLGDCWLISAMSVLVTRDELLVGGRSGMELDKDMIVDKEIASILSKGVYPPIFHRFRSKGLFVIRIFKNF